MEVGGRRASKVRFGCGSTSWFADGCLFIVFFPGREQRQGWNSHLPPLVKALIPFMRLHSASQRPPPRPLLGGVQVASWKSGGDTDTLSPWHHPKERDTDDHGGTAGVHWHCPHRRCAWPPVSHGVPHVHPPFSGSQERSLGLLGRQCSATHLTEIVLFLSPFPTVLLR